MHVLVNGEERERDRQTQREREEGSDTVGAWVNINKREKRKEKTYTQKDTNKKTQTKDTNKTVPLSSTLHVTNYLLLPPSLPLSLPPYLISQCSCCARFSSYCDTQHPRVQKYAAPSRTSLAPCSPVCTGGRICSWGDRG